MGFEGCLVLWAKSSYSTCVVLRCSKAKEEAMQTATGFRRAEVTSVTGESGFVRLLDGSGRTARFHRSALRDQNADIRRGTNVTVNLKRERRKGWQVSFLQVSRQH